VARSLELNRTVVHRLLSTLHQRGFISRQRDGYVPGPIIIRIANGIQPELRTHGRAVMLELSESVGETVVLHIPDGEDAVVLEQVVSERHVVRVEHKIGSRHPLRQGASGRAMLAFLPTALSERVVRNAESPDALERQLQGVRQLGYALSHDELQMGVHGLAVPVLDAAGTAAASLAILVPTTRASGLGQHTEALLAHAERLSKTMFGEFAPAGRSVNGGGQGG
jgi:DNA-binding IclR family transcriptional regulator